MFYYRMFFVIITEYPTAILLYTDFKRIIMELLYVKML